MGQSGGYPLLRLPATCLSVSYAEGYGQLWEGIGIEGIGIESDQQ